MMNEINQMMNKFHHVNVSNIYRRKKLKQEAGCLFVSEERFGAIICGVDIEIFARWVKSLIQSDPVLSI